VRRQDNVSFGINLATPQFGLWLKIYPLAVTETNLLLTEVQNDRVLMLQPLDAWYKTTYVRRHVNSGPNDSFTNRKVSSTMPTIIIRSPLAALTERNSHGRIFQRYFFASSVPVRMLDVAARIYQCTWSLKAVAVRQRPNNRLVDRGIVGRKKWRRNRIHQWT